MTSTADLFADFPWPTLPGAAAVPVWEGTDFSIGTDRQRVLCFPAEDSNWSEELTEMHETVAGKAHSIDVASRELAVRSLERWLPTAREAPVVLDVGCSSGYVMEEIRRRLPRAAVIGSDYIVRPLLDLGRRMPDLPLLQFDLRRCPLPDQCVDGVTALSVLEHIEQDDEALANIWRILRPGGVVHIEVPAGPGLYDLYDSHLMHHRRYKMAGLLALARRVGFEVVNATHLGALVYPAFWLVKKRNRWRERGMSDAEKAVVVQNQIRNTAESRLMALLMETEMKLGATMRYPVGIRCIVALRRP